MRRLLLLLLWSAVALADTRYEIDLGQAASRTLLITAETECLKADCDFQLPVWNATYQIRDFAQYVMGFEAKRASGEKLPVRLVSPSRWRVEAAPGERLQVRYWYFADSPGPFGCSASRWHVFLNFAQLLVYPVGRLREPMSVAFRTRPAAWKIALELPEQDGAFRARSYDELVDAPAELSAFAEASFQAAGRRIRVVVDAQPDDYDMSRLESTARKVVQAATEIMQDVPFPSYTFIYHFREGGGGGMEHANSTAIDAGTPCRDCDVQGVTAHEFFHLWNVKRIRPQSLEPIDYTGENITPSLWFSEGVTSTYGTYIQLQAGLESRDAFLHRLGEEITRHDEIPAHLTQSAEESSISAWLERYPAYGRPARSISYYLKGELAGYLLDLVIRHDSGNRASLDDVMHRLNAEYAQKGRYFEDTAAIERLASQAAGHDLKEVFDRLVRRAEPVDWGHFLSYAGYRLTPSSEMRPTLGIEMSRAPGRGPVIADVTPDGPGEKAGLRAGDRLVSINGRPLKRPLTDELQALRLKPGSKITLAVESRGETKTFRATPKFERRTVYRIEEVRGTDAAAKAVREGWLRAGRIQQNTN